MGPLMEEEKLEWRRKGGDMVGNGRGRVLCGGEGGRAGRGAVDVDQKLEGMEEVTVEELMVMEELMAEEEELMASVELADVDMKVVVAKEVAEGRGTRGGERLTVLPSGGSRGSGDGEAYGGGGVYSGIVMEVVVVKEVVWWYKRKIPQWWLRR
ncbi:hypothetical protein HID58_061178 [Brassica napus]|uniref:Uncharacterized protein n=1 Tax=Brassica napus TaxID=3708 RepID=A0ABQ7ZYE8_BRANA|nr:hypothetical protein HID58_061178 [Brassica napus]